MQDELDTLLKCRPVPMLIKLIKCMRNWFWWPTVRTHAIAGGIALVAVAILGLFEVPRFTFFKDYTTLQLSASGFLSLAFVVSAMNACFFYLHARGDYLRMRNALRPILMSFAALSLLFTAGWAITHCAFKGAPVPDFHTLVDGGLDWLHARQVSAATVHEWTRVFRVLFIGEAGLTAVLLFSGLWKAPPQDTLDFAGTMSRAQPLIRRIFRGQTDVSDIEFERLEVLLKGLVDSAAKLLVRELRDDDLDFARKVSKAAGLLDGVLKARPKGTLGGLRDSDNVDLLSAVKVLLGE